MPRGKEVLSDVLKTIPVDELSALSDQLQSDDLFSTLEEQDLNRAYSRMKPFLREERQDLTDEISAMPNSSA